MGESNLIVGKHLKPIPVTEYREAFFWRCCECGWLGEKLFGMNAAMAEAREHWRAAHPGKTSVLVERRDEEAAPATDGRRVSMSEDARADWTLEDWKALALYYHAALLEISMYGGGDGGDWVECCNLAKAALNAVAAR